MSAKFHLDVIEAEEAHEPFTFDSEGIEWRVPHPRDLNMGQIIALDNGMAGDVRSAVLAVQDVAERFDPESGEWVKDPVQAAAMLLGKRPRVVGQLLAAWAAHAGLQPGESRASSPS